MLEPAVVRIAGIPAGAWYRVIDASGEPVAALRPGAASALLPPGEYRLQIDDQSVPIQLSERQTLEIQLE